MRHLKMNITIVLIVILTVSCKDNNEKNSTKNESVVTEKVMQTNLEFNTKDLAEVYSNYSKIKTALVNSDSNETVIGAELMAKSLEKIVNNDAANKAVKIIQNTTDLNTQRVAFFTLSNEVETLIKGNITSGVVYKEYCPMAFKTGASWLSSNKEIRNPYYGSKMLKCGSIKEILK